MMDTLYSAGFVVANGDSGTIIAQKTFAHKFYRNSLPFPKKKRPSKCTPYISKTQEGDASKLSYAIAPPAARPMFGQLEEEEEEDADLEGAVIMNRDQYASDLMASPGVYFFVTKALLPFDVPWLTLFFRLRTRMTV